MAEQTVFIGLGTNLGDREARLRAALKELAQIVRIRSCSSVYETEPLEYEDQGWFLNMVIKAETALSSRQLLEALLAAELRLGRKKTVPKGPRALDLDILFFGDEIRTEADLVIPHPAIPSRGFVLVPLCEIAPAFMHPVLKRDIESLLQGLPGDKQVRKYGMAVFP